MLSGSFITALLLDSLTLRGGKGDIPTYCLCSKNNFGCEGLGRFFYVQSITKF